MMKLRHATLRPPNSADADAFFAMNSDPQVMRWFPAPMTREESDSWLARMIEHQAEHGFTFCPLDLPGAPCIGVVGLLSIPWQARFTPAVEIGWRIHPAWQRQGLAEEAARMVLAQAFETLRLPEIVAFTAPGNTASWRLMEKLGMAADGEFEHPRLPEGHALRRHLLYRIKAPPAP